MQMSFSNELPERTPEIAEQEPVDNLVSMDVHPDLTVLYGNLAFGNVDPRFGEPDEVMSNRWKLFGASGCSNMVLLVPHASDMFHDLSKEPLTFPKADYSPWQEAIRPKEDVVYRWQTAPFMLDVPGDGLITNKPQEALSMNGADCPAVVLYDREHKILGVGHVGRKGAIADILPKMLGVMQEDHSTDPEAVIVHFGPSIAGSTHVMKDLNHPLNQPEWEPYVELVGNDGDTEEGGYGIHFVDFAIDRLIEECGVPEANITPPPAIDVGTDPNFFSLTQHEKDKERVPIGRNAFVAVIN
jgi:copper oxidase (laccase) domain-containing protein